MLKKSFPIIFLYIFVVSLPAKDLHRMEAEAEFAIAGASHNDVRIPKAGGSIFSLVHELAAAPVPVFRLRLGVRFFTRHLISILYAPLQFNARGSINRDIRFNGKTFPAGKDFLTFYKFNSYRLTYRFSIFWRDNLDIAVGLTGKIRDAEIALYGAESSQYPDLGFVPLINLHVAWQPGKGPFGLLFDLDALAAPQGGAADALLAFTWQLRPNLELRLGYRTLLGGADGSGVYTFTWLHYGLAGIRLIL